MRLTSVLTAGMMAGCVLVSVYAARASSDFGVPAVLNDQSLMSWPSMEIATDGEGTWVIVWKSDDPDLGIEVFPGVPVVSRSIDGGRTWSDPVPLTYTWVDTWQRPALATDRNGVWVAAWTERGVGVVTRTSNDNAATWGPPVEVASDGFSDVHLATDEGGNWLIVGSQGTPSGYSEIRVSRSTDQGSFWSVPSAIGTATERYAHGARLASNRDGTWLLCWQDAVDVLVSRSHDAGASWELPTIVGSLVPSIDEDSCDIATDGENAWVVVWKFFDYTFDSLHFARSSDGGASWLAASPLHPYMESSPSTFARTPRLAFGGDGRWQVVWMGGDSLRGIIGAEPDILTSHSRDNGASWSSPAALVSRAQFDASEAGTNPAIARDSSGHTIVAWSDWPDREIHGAIWLASAVRDCPTIPREDCHQSTAAEGSKLDIKDAVGGADRLRWRFSKGAETTDAEIGDPINADQYVACLYAELPGSLIGEWDAAAGGLCEGQPCWSKREGSARYRDRGRERGSINSLSLRAGEEGRSSIRMKASGPALSPPRLPLDLTSPVRIQLNNLGTGACWSATHTHASVNSELKFSSASD